MMKRMLVGFQNSVTSNFIKGTYKLHIENMRMNGCWKEVMDAARTTIGKSESDNEPSDEWKRKILLAEHSPIRLIKFQWKWIDIPYWVSVHFVRHKIGIEHFVKTSRTDRTGINRDELPQGNLVNHECEANVQSLINISRKRICKNASLETQNAWKLVVEEVEKIDPIIASVLVPDCCYRGGVCQEFRSCEWNKTEAGQKRLQNYRSRLK